MEFPQIMSAICLSVRFLNSIATFYIAQSPLRQEVSIPADLFGLMKPNFNYQCARSARNIVELVGLTSNSTTP